MTDVKPGDRVRITYEFVVDTVEHYDYVLEDPDGTRVGPSFTAYSHRVGVTNPDRPYGNQFTFEIPDGAAIIEIIDA